MRKKLDTESLVETEGPMNQVAFDDALTYLGLDDCETLSPVEEKIARAKKRKIVTASKKMDRRISREVTRKANGID